MHVLSDLAIPPFYETTETSSDIRLFITIVTEKKDGNNLVKQGTL